MVSMGDGGGFGQIGPRGAFGIGRERKRDGDGHSQAGTGAGSEAGDGDGAGAGDGEAPAMFAVSAANGEEIANISE